MVYGELSEDLINEYRRVAYYYYRIGLTQEEIVETFIHCIPYVGFPKVLNAIFIAKEIFNDEK